MDPRFLELFGRPQFRPLQTPFLDVYMDLNRQNKIEINELNPSSAWLEGGVTVVKEQDVYAELRHRVVNRGGSTAVLLQDGMWGAEAGQELEPPTPALGYDIQASCALAVWVDNSVEAYVQRLVAYQWAERAGISTPSLFGSYTSPLGQPPRFVTATQYERCGDIEELISREVKAHKPEPLPGAAPTPEHIGPGMLAMAQGIAELVDKLHQAGIVLVNPSLRSFSCSRFGSKDIKLSCLANLRAVGSSGDFHAGPRELHGSLGDASPDLLCSGEGGKHTNLWDVGVLLYQLLLDGSTCIGAHGQRVHFTAPHKMLLLERHMQRTVVTTMRATWPGLKPVLAYQLAHMVLIMTSPGPHRPAMSWCCEFLRRIELAVMVTQQAPALCGLWWGHGQDRMFELYQRTMEMSAFMLEPAPAMYGGGEVYPAKQLQSDTLLAYEAGLLNAAELYQHIAHQEMHVLAPPKPPTAFDPQALLAAQWGRFTATFQGECLLGDARQHCCEAHDAALAADGWLARCSLAICPLQTLTFVAAAHGRTASEVVVCIEIGRKPWAPASLLDEAVAMERKLLDAAAAAAAAAAAVAADQRAPAEAAAAAAQGAADAPRNAGDGKVQNAPLAIRVLQAHNGRPAAAAPAHVEDHQPAGGTGTRAAGEKSSKSSRCGFPPEPKRQRQEQQQPEAENVDAAAAGEPGARPAAQPAAGHLAAGPAHPAAPPAAAAEQLMAASLRDAYAAAVVMGAPAGPAKAGVLLQSLNGSWRSASTTPYKGPGVYLLHIKPFGQDYKQPEPAEYRLPNGYGKNRSTSNTLRRITFLYTHSGNKAFTNIEQHAAAQVLEEGLLLWLRRAASGRASGGPLYLSLPLASAVPAAQRIAAAELDPAHHPVVFQFMIKPSSGLTWQQAAEAGELWAGTRPPILTKLVERPLFDSSMLRRWLLQAAFTAPTAGLNWRQHNTLGASGWCQVVKAVLGSTESLLRLPARSSDRYAGGSGYVAADWEELPPLPVR